MHCSTHTAAAGAGLSPAPESRSRGARPHLSCSFTTLLSVQTTLFSCVSGAQLASQADAHRREGAMEAEDIGFSNIDSSIHRTEKEVRAIAKTNLGLGVAERERRKSSHIGNGDSSRAGVVRAELCWCCTVASDIKMVLAGSLMVNLCRWRPNRSAAFNPQSNVNSLACGLPMTGSDAFHEIEGPTPWKLRCALIAA